jgi:hypothetical protein
LLRETLTPSPHVENFCEIYAHDFKWVNDLDHKPDAASMQVFVSSACSCRREIKQLKLCSYFGIEFNLQWLQKPLK